MAGEFFGKLIHDAIPIETTSLSPIPCVQTRWSVTTVGEKLGLTFGVSMAGGLGRIYSDLAFTHISSLVRSDFEGSTLFTAGVLGMTAIAYLLDQGFQKYSEKINS